MKIDTGFPERCIGTLEAAFERLGRQPTEDLDRDIFRAACVKEFELVLEQGGNLPGKRLRPFSASNRRADRLTFKDRFRCAAKHALIPVESCERWLRYRDIRNDAAHLDGEAFAEATIELVPRFLDDAKELARVLAEGQSD